MPEPGLGRQLQFLSAAADTVGMGRKASGAHRLRTPMCAVGCVLHTQGLQHVLKGAETPVAAMWPSRTPLPRPARLPTEPQQAGSVQPQRLPAPASCPLTRDAGP